ncbi:MAG: FAD-dependent oxidoreductase, partial [Promethearchaeota archaeon]
KVVVIGGGSTATDAARVSKRLGADVSILYRREKEQMPAGKAEIRDTEEEGILIKYLTNPVEFVCTENEFQIAVCQKVTLGDVDESGRPKPILIDNSDFKIKADYLIEAIGQEPNLEGFDMHIFKITRANTFEVDEKFFTSVHNVLAGGDCVTGSKSVVDAVAQGKIIASQIKILLK